MLWTLPRDHFEILMKAGEIIEPTLKTQLLDADPVVDKQFAGMPHTYLRKELRIRLARPGFKIPAEGIRHKSDNSSYLLQVDLLRKMTQRIVINGIDTLALLFRKIMTKPNGGQQMWIGGSRKSRKTFNQRNDPSHPFRMTDLFNQRRNIAVLTRVDL